MPTTWRRYNYNLIDVIQVSNKLPYTMEIFYLTEEDETKACGFVEPRDLMNLPNSVVATPPFTLLFRPRLPGYVLS